MLIEPVSILQISYHHCCSGVYVHHWLGSVFLLPELASTTKRHREQSILLCSLYSRTAFGSASHLPRICTCTTRRRWFQKGYPYSYPQLSSPAGSYSWGHALSPQRTTRLCPPFFNALSQPGSRNHSPRLRQRLLLSFCNLTSNFRIDTSISTQFLKHTIYGYDLHPVLCNWGFMILPLLFWPGKIWSHLCSRASYFHLLHPWENSDLEGPHSSWEGRGLCNTKG